MLTLVRQKRLTRDNDIVDLVRPRTLLARFPGSDKPRKAEHVPPSERQVALIGLVTESPGISREELLRETARFFGWGRLGADIRTTLEHDIDELLDAGRLAPTVNGLVVVGDPVGRPADTKAAEPEGPVAASTASEETGGARCLRLLEKDGYEILKTLEVSNGVVIHMALHPNLQLPDRGSNIMCFACVNTEGIRPGDVQSVTDRLIEALAVVDTVKGEASPSLLWILVTGVAIPDLLDGFAEHQGLMTVNPDTLAAWETGRLVPYFDEDGTPDVGSRAAVSLMLEPTS